MRIVRTVRCSRGSVAGRGHRILEIQVTHVFVTTLLVVEHAFSDHLTVWENVSRNLCSDEGGLIPSALVP